MKKLDVFQTLKSGISLGLLNSLSIFAAVLLYLLTIWIPYINVGTTIAMSSIPLELSKGKVISPFFIFDSIYRRKMGEFFILCTLEFLALLIGLCFGVIPMYVIAIAWSLAVYLLLDKDLNPMQALQESNRLTYGNKWRIFAVELILGLIVGLFMFIFFSVTHFAVYDYDSDSYSTISIIVSIIWGLIYLLCVPALVCGCHAVIYRELSEPDEENASEQGFADQCQDIKTETETEESNC